MPGWRAVVRLIWAILGIPVTVFLFVLLIVLMFPIGGGIDHMLFAYSPGGNLEGARTVFIGFLLDTALVTSFLRLTRYPLPRYGTAILVSALALWQWLPMTVLSSDLSASFRLQGLLLAPLLPATAFAVSFWFKRQQR